MAYLILQNPGHNRVYFNSADKLALAELKIACSRLSVNYNQVEIEEIENIRYLYLDTDEELSPFDLQLLSSLSFVFAIFRKCTIEGKVYLQAIRKFEYKFLDQKLSTLLKYHGKTNELFTKMMVNVALLSSNFDYSDNIQLLDPVAGRGTTLFEAAIYGFNVFGIEIDGKSVHDTSVFISKYLKTERIKHSQVKRQVYSQGKSERTYIQEFEYAMTKEQFKLGNNKVIGIVEGNTQKASRYFKQNSFHLIVGDLPYGIVHGNTGDRKTSSGTRNPSELLESCIAEWYKVLKPGGVIVIAWNVFVASKQKLASIFKTQGLELLMDPPYMEFEHMVDKSIKRDILVAKKV